MTYTISNVTAQRIDKDTFKVSWENVDEKMDVEIYLAERPDSFDYTSPVASVSGKTSVRIRALGYNARPYFKVLPQRGPGIVTAERRVSLEGSVNFRDLGGYGTSNGHTVKWGQVFRSDSLARLTDRDQAVLLKTGIRVVCDFRTPSEVNNAPDRLPDAGGIEYLHLPVVHGEFDSIEAMERIRKGDIGWLSKDFMVKGYIRNIEEFGGIWGEVINRIIEPRSRPLVFHCTGGKDRAGVCAALILLALGVPEETVILDHGLSNMYIAELVESIYKWFRKEGIDPEKVAPYFTAPRECIVSLLEHMGKTYGSVAHYLKVRSGVDDQKLTLLRQELLE
ncbi:MAG: tyrosine-protein phosphatase [Pseudomonadota bacterium]